MKMEIKVYKSWPEYQTQPRDITHTPAQPNLPLSGVLR